MTDTPRICFDLDINGRQELGQHLIMKPRIRKHIDMKEYLRMKQILLQLRKTKPEEVGKELRYLDFSDEGPTRKE